MAAFDQMKTATAGILSIVGLITLGALIIIAPMIWRIPLVVVFILALRFVARRPGVAEWAYLKGPHLILCVSVLAGVLAFVILVPTFGGALPLR